MLNKIREELIIAVNNHEMPSIEKDFWKKWIPQLNADQLNKLSTVLKIENAMLENLVSIEKKEKLDSELKEKSRLINWNQIQAS